MSPFHTKSMVRSTNPVDGRACGLPCNGRAHRGWMHKVYYTLAGCNPVNSITLICLEFVAQFVPKLLHGRPHIGANGVSWPPWKMNEKLKSENMQKEQFSTFMLYFESNQGRQVQRTALCWPHIYSDILQNAPFRSQMFGIFFASGGKGALTPANQNPADVPKLLCSSWQDFDWWVASRGPSCH